MATEAAQGAVGASANTAAGTIALQRVGAAGAWAGRSATEIDGILADVFDASTGTLRFVGVA